ncbi:MAG: hypothetical protein MMC23_008292 [Stictis urceolatum]|nr:hypothetical protein [Stictis urceolata]
MTPKDGNKANDRELWNKEKLAFLCAFINVHLQFFKSNVSAALSVAAKEISTKFGGNHTEDQINRKIKSVWTNYGADDSQKPDDLYTKGITYHTLPYIRQQSEDFLPEVQVYSQEIRKGPSIRCSCPFDFDDGNLIQCNMCTTKQHVQCFYSQLKHPPTEHICTYCQELVAEGLERVTVSGLQDCVAETLTNKETSLSDLRQRYDTLANIASTQERVKNISIQGRDSKIRQLQQQLKESRELGQFTTFGTSVDHDELFGPDDIEVEREMYKLRKDLSRVVVELNQVSRGVPVPSSIRGPFETTLSKVLQRLLSDGKENTDMDATLQKKISTLYLEYTLAGVLALVWKETIFYSNPLPSLCPTSLVHQAQSKCIMTTDGMTALRRLDLAVWTLLSHGEVQGIEANILAQGKALAQEASKLVESFLARGQGRDDTRKVQFWYLEEDEWNTRFEILTEVFIRGLRLKLRLPLRQQHFELHQPLPGTKFDPKMMECMGPKPNSSRLMESAKVALCVFPALLSYEAPIAKDHDGSVLQFNYFDFVMGGGSFFRQLQVIAKAAVVLQ